MKVEYELRKRVEEELQNCLNLFEYLHQNPELSCQEFKTSKLLKKIASDLGLEVIPVTNTGFIAILNFTNAGKTLAMRAELDALPILENSNNLVRKKRIISNTQGIMHACGHDAHMAVLISVIKILVQLKEQLSGRIIFIFEEGEENTGSIADFLSFLEKYKIDAFYGSHLHAALPSGKILLPEGPVMAANTIIKMKIIGKGGHASRPDQARNPILAGNQIITNLLTAMPQIIPLEDTVTLGIGKFCGGEAYNIIPSEASLEATMRYFNKKTGNSAIKYIKKISKNIAECHDCEIYFDPIIDRDSLPVINDKFLTQIARNVLAEISPDALLANGQWQGSETFAQYRKIAPTVFPLIGINNPELGTGAAHHSDKFEVDPSSLELSLTLASGFAISYLRN